MMTRTCMAVLAVAFMNTPALGQFVWDGSASEQWNRGSNWEGNIGWPNGINDSVGLRSISGSTRENINLRDNTYDVASIAFVNEQYTLRNGALRLHGGISQTTSIAFSTFFTQVFNINIEQVGNGTWSGDEDSQIQFDGVLSGSGQITVTNSFNTRVANLNAANTYSGTMIINSGSIRLTNSQALQSATVIINGNNGLQFATQSSFRISALGGVGQLNIGANSFMTTGSGNMTFSGNLTGSAGGRFWHNGPGTLTLTGTVSGIDQLFLSIGVMQLDGNSATVQELGIDIGELRIQNGANVSLAGTGHARSGGLGTLKVTGAGSQLRNGVELAASVGTDTGTIQVLDFGSVSDFNIVTAGRVGTGSIIVQQNGSLSATALGLGGRDNATNGGTGELSVLTGGSVNIAGETRLWTNTSSIIISDGAMTTGTLTNPNATSPTIQLSDQDANASLTIGTDDNPASATTFSGTISDLNPGSLVPVAWAVVLPWRGRAGRSCWGGPFRDVTGLAL